MLSKFDLNPQADPNINYNLLSSTISKAKSLHIPKKNPKNLTNLSIKKESWMTNDLSALINKKTICIGIGSLQLMMKNI